MIYLGFGLSLVAILIYLNKRLISAHNSIREKLANMEADQQKVIVDEQRIKTDNKQREGEVANTIKFYEITKQICEFLEEEKVFSAFRDGLKRFVDFKECKYLAELDASESLPDFEIIPLVAKKEKLGYLAISGIDKEERFILDVIVAQLLAGIKRARLYALVQELSITDELTRTSTRSHFFGRFSEELRRLGELDLPLAFLMIDIDDFKTFNDAYGHIVGDSILKSVADAIRSNCREIDLIGRFGGEEFMVALPITTKDGAIFAAERIRKSIESKQIRAFDELLSVTISIGISNFPDDAKSGQELVDKADWALYRSKRTGKNKVSVFARYE